MKLTIRLITCALVALLLVLNGSLAMAANLQFTPQADTTGGAIFGRIPLSKFGALTLPRGRATFKSHSVEISAVAEYQFERQLVLSGPVIKCSCINNGKQSVVNGIAYFQDGDWLRYIDNTSPDKITTYSTTYEGQITALKKGFVEITTGQLITNVPTDQIIAVTSPRAYNFSMVVTPYLAAPQGEAMSGETALVSMKPSADVISLSIVKRDPLMAGDGDISNGKLIALGAVLGAIQITQFIPMTYVFGSNYNHQVNQYHARFENYYSQQNFLSNFLGAGGHYPISNFNPGSSLAASHI